MHGETMKHNIRVCSYAPYHDYCA